MTVGQAAAIVCDICAGKSPQYAKTPSRIYKEVNAHLRVPISGHRNPNSNLTYEFRHKAIGSSDTFTCAASRLWDTTIEISTWEPELIIGEEVYEPGNWGLIPLSSIPMPETRWCPGSETNSYCTDGKWLPSLEEVPEFERSIRLRLSDLNIEDMTTDYDVLKRTLITLMGFTFVWVHSDSIEAWKGDVCLYSPISEKVIKFLGQVEEYAAVYLYPSTNLDYAKLPPVNTLNEKLTFFKSTVHRRHCFCQLEVAK